MPRWRRWIPTTPGSSMRPDTIKESYLLANPETVRIVTEGAARSIADLERYGMAFAREEDGRISQRFFGRTRTSVCRWWLASKIPQFGLKPRTAELLHIAEEQAKRYRWICMSRSFCKPATTHAISIIFRI